MRAAWDFALHVANTVPDVWVRMAIAWLFATAATQYAKQFLREDLPEKTRHRATQLIAILFGLAASALLWPYDVDWRLGMCFGGLIALWGPVAFALAQKVIWHHWPWLGEKLSGDKPNPEH